MFVRFFILILSTLLFIIGCAPIPGGSGYSTSNSSSGNWSSSYSSNYKKSYNKYADFSGGSFCWETNSCQNVNNNSSSSSNNYSNTEIASEDFDSGYVSNYPSDEILVEKKNDELKNEELKEKEKRLTELEKRQEKERIAIEKEKKKLENERKKLAEKKEAQEREKEKYELVYPVASGSGFFTSKDGYIITNYHVIEECDVINAFMDGKSYKAYPVAQDKFNDLAILKSDINPKDYYGVVKQDAALLEDVIVAGYPLGKKVSASIKTTKGSITSLAGFNDNYSQFQTDAALNQGNSGGPIINEKGNVVGVAVAVYGKEEGIESFNFGIKSSTLRSFASSNNLPLKEPSNKSLSKKELGSLIVNATTYLECSMTLAKLENLIASQEISNKAFFQELINQ